ncbi:hypothetical protein QN277_001845 [Acacia crassicarpa]|uniref:Terpene synthase metal-binding domain-containing protein n=1 Tax=Acacia crassicarpa TaxID=499986 RepID=A0AAE1N879_9FABA|nr:hypothetical protein QN277_001845 [Acacia crassicarpa]
MDEIASVEKRKYIASSVQCYIKDHGVSRQEDIEELREMIKSTRKDINDNEECLKPTQVPMPFMIVVLNLTRFMDVLYKETDNFTHAEGITKEYITLLFVDPVPL